MPIVLRMRRIVLLVAVVLAVSSTAGTGGAQPLAARLTLDGAAFQPELALTPAQRGRGLMNRRRAPADGMLFVFPYPTTSGFWMKNTLVPLTVVFFNANGQQVKRISMKPCIADPCPIYTPKRLYRFALELRAADRRPAKLLGPRSELRRLVRQSS
jgi:uncharacterized membrane protein (UPF0127 family)